MNASALASAGSGTDNGAKKCPIKKSWFAIKVVDDKESKIVEALTIQLKIPDLGDIERVSSKSVDPIKIDQLTPGGKGDVKQIEHDTEVWEVTVDIT